MNISCSKYLPSILVSVFFWRFALAQSGIGTNPIPPSPQAASLGQFVDMPVGTYTGIPEISIPLLEVTNGDISLPISASYHAGGIKLSQESGILGLGWSLTAGGVISRTLNGKDDFRSDGFAYNQEFPDVLTSGNWVVKTQEAVDHFGWLTQSGIDMEPDFFFYSFGGHSGKLLIKKCPGCTVFEAIPEKPVGLKFTYNNSTKTWNVKDEQGFTYTFQEKEYIIPFAVVQGSPIADNLDPIGQYSTTDEYISSWYLTGIVSPKGHSISFTYKSYGYKSRTVPIKSHRVQKKLSVGGSFQEQHEYSMSAQVINDVYLQQIDFGNGRVEFSTTDRSDILPYTNRQYNPSEPVYLPQRLTSIKLYAGNGSNPEKTISFDNDQYFGSNYSQAPQLYYRLKLDNIKVLDAAGAAVLPYIFSYEIPTAVPAKNSFSIDHWGYFNNANNNSVGNNYFSTDSKTLIPTVIVNDNLGQTVVVRGADRKSSLGHTKLFVLNSIKYPTGALYTYDYELNTFLQAPADYYIADEGPNPNLQTVRLRSSNVFMPQCPYDDAATGSGIKTTEFQITSNTIGQFYGEAINECVYCDVDGQGQPFYYIGDPNNPQNHVSMNLASFDGTYLAKLEKITGPGGSVTSLVKGLRFYYTTPVNTVSDSYLSIHQNCSQGNYVTANENYLDFTVNSGWYKLTVYPINGMESDVTFSYSQPSTNPTAEKAGAGLRVKRITVSDGGTERVKSYEYAGGELMSLPSYTLPLSTYDLYWIFTNGSSAGCSDVSLLLASESSIIPIGSSAQGSFVGYSTVTEYNGTNKEASNGHTIYSFHSLPEDVIHIPIAPNVPGSYHLENGLIHSILHLNSLNQVIKQVNYSYEMDEDSKQEILAAKSFSVMGSPCSAASFAYYKLKVEWWKLIGETVQESTPSGLHESSHTYDYEPFSKKLRRQTLTTSDGSKEVTYTTYPNDYSNTTGFIGEMKSNHLIGFPIEQVRYKEVGSTRTILSGSITTYKTGGKGLVDQVLALETASPLTLSSFKFSNRGTGVLPPSGTAGAYSRDSRYKVRLTYNQYDTKGNPLQYTQADGVPVSYVWGYNNQYPVAEIHNATYPQVTATGVNLSVLGSLTSTDAQKITELAKIRNHTSMNNAQVSTYTYRPLYGMSSSTDASGRTVWYDYDSFGRLWRIRDHFGNVIEEYRYNYRH